MLLTAWEPLVTVIVSRLTSPGKVRVFGEVVFTTTRLVGAAYCRVPLTALTFFTVPPSAVMLPTGMVFTQLLEPVAVTSNSMSQLELAAIVAPVMVMVLAPATAVKLGLPEQVEYALGILAKTMPVGSGSVTLTVLSGAVLLLLRRTITVEVPPELTESGLKLLVPERAEV